MAETNSTPVRTAGLTKVFRDFWLREKVTAVADLTLEIRPGEVFGLLGPNGSGKSTTLKMILGLLFPTRGRISVFGKPPTHVGVKSRIGFLPEESNLYPFLDARETLDFYGRLFRLPRRIRRHRIETLLEMVGLSGVAYRRVGEYSKGMQRRIGLAQALINDPDLLILDEPASGLDPIGTRQFKDLLLTLARRGKTILLSSHLLADVEDVCDRVCILYGGRQRAMGGIDELLARSDRMQILTEPLDEQTIQAIRSLLADRGRELLGVQTPRDRLETLFLRIVEEAHQRRWTTGGAVSTGRVADFLRDSDAEGLQLIESLLAGGAEEKSAQVASTEAASVAPPKQAGADAKILQSLLGETKGGEPSASSPPAPREPSPPLAADRRVIDELLGRANDEGDASP